MKRTNFTLNDIRAITTEDELGRAAAWYAVTQSTVTVGEAYAMKRTLQSKAEDLGISRERLEYLACENFNAAIDMFKKTKER